MKDVEKAKYCRKLALNKFGEVNQYDWDSAFSVKEIKSAPKEFLEHNPEYRINLGNLSESDLNELGFGRWSKESDLRLIPIWMKPFCKNTKVKSITGETVMLNDADNDHRFGYLAYGIIPNKKR